MTHVVAEPCRQCKHTDCVDVCPVDCFHEGANFLAIDPEEDSPERWTEYLELNERLRKVWPVLAVKKEALADADHWGSVESRRERLSEVPGPGTES